MATAEEIFKERITEKKPWTNKQFSRFWAVARDLEYSKDDVHQLFGLESMKDYGGTLTDALAVLESVQEEPPTDFPPADEEFDPQPPAKPAPATNGAAWYGDAPASVCIGTYGPGGFDVQWTLRDAEAHELVKRVTGLLDWLPKHGYRPKYGNGNGPRNARGGNGAQPSGEAPVCNLHNRAMKRSKFQDDEWICTAKLADGSYCTEKVKDAK